MLQEKIKTCNESNSFYNIRLVELGVLRTPNKYFRFSGIYDLPIKVNMNQLFENIYTFGESGTERHDIQSLMKI